jgi:phospholipid transport system transporter-binding protein
VSDVQASTGAGGGAGFDFATLGAGRYRVSGAMTFATAAALHAAGLVAFAAGSESQLELDCAAVTAADSAGLAVLVDWLAWARGAGRALKLRNLPAKLVDIARISELDELLVPA